MLYEITGESTDDRVQRVFWFLVSGFRFHVPIHFVPLR